MYRIDYFNGVNDKGEQYIDSIWVKRYEDLVKEEERLKEKGFKFETVICGD